MLESALILSLLNSSSSSSSSAEDFLPTSLRSGCGLALVGSVCSRQPPDDSSSRSLEFLHFILRFWNQIFTCRWREERRRKNGEWKKSSASSASGMRHSVITHTLRIRIWVACDVFNYLWVFQAQLGGQLLPVGLADVFLFLEHFLQGFALHIGEHRPPQHPSAGFPSSGQGPRKGPGNGNNGWRC